MAVASLWRSVLRRAMGKWRSKSSYSRAPDDATLSPDDALAAAGGCTTLLPAVGVKGSINAAAGTGVGATPAAATTPGTGSDADDRLLGTNGALDWESGAAEADDEGPEEHSAGNNNGRAPIHNGSALLKANGHPRLCVPDALALARPPPGGGGDGPDGSPLDEAGDTLDEDDEDAKCGLGPFSPGWLQIFASKQAFLVTFCIAWVLQGMYYTYFVSVITTIEKLFQIQSKTTGIIMSATEIGQIGSSLLLTYYGGQGHRPKWIAWGMVLFSVSSFTCAVPHFVFGQKLIEANDLLYMGVASVGNSYHTGNTSDVVGNVCRAEDSPLLNTTCEAWSDDRRLHAKHTTIVLAIFFISLLGVGMGQTAVYTLGIPYIDDNVASRESPLYFAITIGVRILGPALGFLLGSMCTRIYADPYSDPQISPTDPRWVGAWWLGLVLVSSLLMLTSIAMFAFPKRLKTSINRPRPLRRGKKNPSLRDFPKAVKRLLKNDILMFRTASSVLHILPIAGLYTFLPKYLESQFRLPAHEANMVSGSGGILVMGLGIIISGVYILKYKPNARFVAAWIAFTAVIYAIGMGLLMFIGCPMDDFAGLEIGRTPSFMPVCESNCQCDLKKFGPICGNDSLIYFSACHAGCRNITVLDGRIHGFSDCQCIKTSGNNSLDHIAINDTATGGICPLKCQNYVWYILLFSVFVFIHSTSEVGSMLLILRCVDPRDKAMALGLIQFAIGLFGNVPCPIVYGAVVDYACMVWETTACGDKGACWLYDSNIFRMFYHGTTGAILLCAFFVDIIVWYKSGSINFVDDPPGPGQEEELNPITGRRSETSV